MARGARSIAIKWSDYALVTALLALASGLIALGVASTRIGLATATHVYTWSGAFYAALFWALMCLFMVGRAAWRSARGLPREPQSELPSDVPVADMRRAAVEMARVQAPLFAFLVLLALASPRLGAALAGFSLAGLALLPIWLIQRRRPPKYLVRGPKRLQTQWYEGRASA